MINYLRPFIDETKKALGLAAVPGDECPDKPCRSHHRWFHGILSVYVFFLKNL